MAKLSVKKGSTSRIEYIFVGDSTSATGTGLSNYTISYVNGNLTVNTKALTIAADAQSTTIVNAFVLTVKFPFT